MSELGDKTKKKEKHKFVTLIEKAYEDAEKNKKTRNTI